MTALKKFSNSDKIILVWVPGHQGNGMADCLATEGLSKDFAIRLPFGMGKAIMKNMINQEHLSRWKKCEGCRRSKLMIKQPSTSRTNGLLAMNRLKLGTTIGLLTGHIALKVHAQHENRKRRRISYLWMQQGGVQLYMPLPRPCLQKI